MASDPQLDAGGIVQRQFTTARRGYDADEVRTYLHELANAVRTLQRTEAELRERVEKAESRAHKAEQLDEHRLVEILGEETARVLDAARAASTDIRGKAEESASRLISEANHEAHRVRAESEAALAAQRTELLAEVEKLRAEAAGELERRRAEGAEIVAQMRREAQAECDSLRQQGEQKRLEAEMQAETIRSKAREEGRALIAEAQVVRERVLGDLARRRRTAREQLERLNAARERLLAAYEVVRRTVDEATGELTVVLPEAKVAGDSAVRRVQGEPEPSVEQLEDMVAMARITGLLEDAASQGFDEEDYLADDAPAPPSEVEGDEADEAREPDEPVELYDLESEPDLVADEDGVEGLEVAEPEPDAVVTVDNGAGPAVEVEPAAAPVNGHARPVVPTVAAESEPEHEGAMAAVALAVDVDVETEEESEEIDLATAEILDDRRINGHPHPSVEVDDDEDEDLDEDDDWFDDEEEDEDDDGAGDHGAASSVDELFARLKADRAQPADDEVDEAVAGEEIEEPEHAMVPAAPSRVSSLAAMSDADILASAGYGDTGEDGYGGFGPGERDDFADESEQSEEDLYGLPITQPDPQTVVAAFDGEGVDEVHGEDVDDGADEAEFADMDPDEAMLRLRDDSLETVEHDLSRRLKRVLADEQNEILDTLRRNKPGNLDELLPGGREAHVARYVDAAVEGLSTAAAWGAASVEGEPTGSYEALAGELGKTVVEPLRERIARSFTEAAGDVDDMTGRLRALYREWKGHHLAAAAQHYAVAAYARGAYEAVPDGTQVRWLVDRGTDPCPDADDNALAGSVCKGEAFPTGDRCAPAHPGCRCMVVPIDWPRLG